MKRLLWIVCILLMSGCAAPPEEARFGENWLEASEGVWRVRVEWPTGSPWRRVTYRNANAPWLGEVRRVMRVEPYAFTWEQETPVGKCTHRLVGHAGRDAFELGGERVSLFLRHLQRADLTLSKAAYQSYWVPATLESPLPRALGKDGVSVMAQLSHDSTPRGFTWDPQGVRFFGFGSRTRIDIDIEPLFLNGLPTPLEAFRPLLRGRVILSAAPSR